MMKNMSLKGSVCPDDNLKSTLPIVMKCGK